MTGGAADAAERARIELVEEHIRAENRHDLDAVMATYSESSRFDDEPYGERHVGRAHVRAYYEGLMHALPDLHIGVDRTHASDEAVIVECTITGTHLGEWRGLPATGRRLRFPLCAIYTFDGDRLAGERVYYDRAAVLRQVGMFHEPDAGWGRVATAISHPLTLARAFARTLGPRRTR